MNFDLCFELERFAEEKYRTSRTKRFIPGVSHNYEENDRLINTLGIRY